MPAHRRLNEKKTRAVLATIPFSRLLGFRLARFHRDGITLECAIQGKLLNSARALHGGVSAAIADAAAGVALHRHLGSHRPITTVEMKVNYMKPVQEGHIRARSHLLHVGSTLCVARVDLSDAKARAIGTALVTYMILSRPRSHSS